MKINLDKVLYNIQSRLDANQRKAKAAEEKEKSLLGNINSSKNDNDSLYGDAISLSGTTKATDTTKSSTETKKETIKRESSTRRVTPEEAILEYAKVSSAKSATSTSTTSSTSSTKSSSNSSTSTTSSTSKPTVEEFKTFSAEIKNAHETYTEKMNNRKMLLAYNTSSGETKEEDMTYKNFMTYANSIGQYRIVNKEGNIVVSSINDIPDSATVGSDGNYYTEDGTKYIIVSDITNTEYFQTALRDGSLTIQKENNESWENQILTSMSIIRDILDTSDDAEAKEEYDKKMAEIESNSKYAKIIKEYDTIAEKYIDKTKLEEIQKTYNDKMNKKELKLVYIASGETKTEDLTYSSIMNSIIFNGKYRIVNTEGNIIVASESNIPDDATKYSDNTYYSADRRKYIIVSDITNKEYFQTALKEGKILLIEQESDDGTKWKNVKWENISAIKEVTDTDIQAQAEEEYEKALAELKDEAYIKYLSE